MLDVVAELRRRHRRLPRRHPVVVAAQRVDLAVVGDHAVGMRERPGRERVGREALVHQRERALEVRIVQVRVIGAELIGEEHALVDQRAARDRHRVIMGERAARACRRASRRWSCAGCRAGARNRVLRRDRRAAREEDLLVHGLGRLDRFAERRIVGRHVAPAEKLHAFLRRDCRVGVHDLLRARPLRAAGTARRPHSGRVRAGRSRSRRAFLAKNLCGVCTRMPAPSPARGSAPTAPRCSRLSRMVSASSTILCDLRPLMSAMKPTPQESFSCAGSNSPKPCAPKTLRAHRRSRASPPWPYARAEVLAQSLAARRSRSFSTAAAEKGYGSGARGRAFFLEATFVPPGDLPRPAVPGCLSAALRRALALGGWPPRLLLPLFSHPLPEKKEPRDARVRPKIGTAILSYAEHGKFRAITRATVPFFRAQKGDGKEAHQAFGFGPLRLRLPQCPAAASGPRQARKRNGHCRSRRPRFGACGGLTSSTREEAAPHKIVS